jgi:uncharacterized membrane-anchored protein YitT (DUF2179 family)
VAVNGILIPQRFYGAGFTGVALLIHYMFSSLPVAILYLIQGGYTGREEQILYTVISFRELPQLKRLVRGIDPDAFVVVTDTLEVMGHRIGNQPHW